MVIVAGHLIVAGTCATATWPGAGRRRAGPKRAGLP